MLLEAALFERVDIGILRTLNENCPSALASVLQVLTNASPYLSGLVPLMFLLVAIHRSHLRRVAYTITSAYLLSVLVSTALKYIVNRPRPFVTYPFIHKLSTGGSGSFPSGHTSDVFAVATVLILLCSRRSVAFVTLTWAFLIAYTRMALGVHYPSDVLGGAILGAGSAWLCVRAREDLKRGRMYNS